MGQCCSKQPITEDYLVESKGHNLIEAKNNKSYNSLKEQFENAYDYLNTRSFIVEQVLEKGQSNVIVSAKNEVLNQQYIIKIHQIKSDKTILDQSSKQLTQSDNTQQEQLLKSLQQEVEVMNMINHRNIAQSNNQFIHDDFYFIVMEQHQMTLSDYYSNNKEILQEVEIIQIWEQLISGLEALHEQKAFIRDLKLERLFINDLGVIKYYDFSFSSNANSYLITTYLNNLHESSYHLPPEILSIIMNEEIKNKEEYFIANKIDQDETGDIWALGMMMLQLSGVNPNQLIQFNSQGGHINTPNICNEAKSFIIQILERNKEKRPTIERVREHFLNFLREYAKKDPQFSQKFKMDEPINELKNTLIDKEESQLNQMTEEEKEILKLGKMLTQEVDLLTEVTRKVSYKHNAFVYNSEEQEDPEVIELGPIQFFSDESVYKGQWKNGQKYGRGQQMWKDGSIYTGYWMNNMAHGKGRKIQADGVMYEGDWQFDKKNGFGVMIDGLDKYVGDWVDDKKHGSGVFYYLEGLKYEGEFFENKKQGKGVFTWADSSFYEGDFQNDFICGQGTYVWTDSKMYKGEWKNNQMDGKGIFTWPDGKKYVGDYSKDKKHGNGEFTWPDDRKYNGSWHEGKQHGFGVYYNQNQGKRGEWSNGSRIRWIT